jgi:hypothetical protein
MTGGLTDEDEIVAPVIDIIVTARRQAGWRKTTGEGGRDEMVFTRDGLWPVVLVGVHSEEG